GLVGKPDELLDDVQLALVVRERRVVPLDEGATSPPVPLQTGVSAHLLPPTIPSGQPAAGQRTPRDDAHPVPLARRQYLVLDAANEDRVRRLLAHEPRQPAAFAHPLGLGDEERGERRA